MSTPETFYREAIDLNRYSNQVARQIVTNYNNVILDLTNKLATIDEVTAPATVARIRAMLVQMKESLEGWSNASSVYLADELQGLAVFQTEFVKDQLERVLPKGAVGVNTVKNIANFCSKCCFLLTLQK